MNSWKLEIAKRAREAGLKLVGDVESIDDLPAYSAVSAPVDYSFFDGSKFAGGFGTTRVQTRDYWTLRARSSQLFTENLYARGLIRRLVTNEINTGLTPEATPFDDVLGGVAPPPEWSEMVESRFAIWGNYPAACDWFRRDTFGAIQRAARREALVSGDVLVVLRFTPPAKRPMVQLISGNNVQTPWGAEATTIRKGHEIRHGVEFDTVGRHAAFWVRQSDGKFKRLPAYGEKSGRRIAWLVYGTDKRLDDVRGEPLLSIVLQSLKEIDRYRDSTQRKAVINSLLALFIKKTSDKPGTLPMTGGAARRDSVSVADGTTGSAPRKFNINQYLPGVIIDELQEGEEPVLKGGEGTDVNFGAFEEAIIQAVAWANEIPPEILRLAFSNNYSASQAAINEFKIYLNRVWSEWGAAFCQPIYEEWLLSEVLSGGISAAGLLDAWRDRSRMDEFAAWTAADWYGSIKPSTDMLKQVKASELLVAGGYSSRAREARITTGTKFSRNVKRLKVENEQLSEAMRPMLELRQEFGQEAVSALADEIIEGLATEAQP